MQAIELVALLKPFKAIKNRNALSPTYRALELTATKIIARAAYAHVEVNLGKQYKLPIEESVFVDTATFLAVVASLPADGEVSLTVTPNTLDWACGASKGRLARAAITDAPSFNYRASTKAYKPDAAFKQALELGGLSCDAQSQEAFGLYGVTIDNRDDLVICSSDDTTISVASLYFGGLNAPDIMTLHPESAELLYSLIDPDIGQMEFSERYIIYADAKVRCRVALTEKPLERDLRKVYRKFEHGKMVAQVPAERVMAFTKRAAAMAESKQHTTIAIGASNGRLTIGFMEGMSESDEYYLVEDLKLKTDLSAIHVDAAQLARGLAHINRVVLDYLEQKAIVFQNSWDKLAFTYLVSGKQEV